jgi:hypothetical protein
MANIDWEVRAKERRLVNKRLNKKIKELTHSRDVWKGKATERKAEVDDLYKKLAVVKKNLQQIIGL